MSGSIDPGQWDKLSKNMINVVIMTSGISTKSQYEYIPIA